MARNPGRRQHGQSQEDEVQQTQATQAKKGKQDIREGAEAQGEQDQPPAPVEQTPVQRQVVSAHTESPRMNREGGNETPTRVKIYVAKATQTLEKSVEYEMQGMEQATALIVAITQTCEMLQVEAQLIRYRCPPPELPPQAYRALVLYSEGHTLPEIARRWGVSPETVKTHLGRACDALGVIHRKDALVVAKALAII